MRMGLVFLVVMVAGCATTGRHGGAEADDARTAVVAPARPSPAYPQQERPPEARFEKPTDYMKLLPEVGKDPVQAKKIMSASLCAIAVSRELAERQIEAEYEYAKNGGGVINLTRIDYYQRQLRACDGRQAKVQTYLNGNDPEKCGERETGLLAVCILAEGGTLKGARPAPCDEPQRKAEATWALLSFW